MKLDVGALACLRITRLAAVLLLVAAAGRNALALTFEQRVEAQAAIERVFYEARTWPAENRGARPMFEEAVPRKVIEMRVREYLRRSVALEQQWGVVLTAELLQAEMDRMEASSRDPRMLQRLHAALGNDPGRIAECLARPALVDRLFEARYGSDGRIHGATLAHAEALAARIGTGRLATAGAGAPVAVELRLEPEEDGRGADASEIERTRSAFPEAGGGIRIHETATAFWLLATIASRENRFSGEALEVRKVAAADWLEAQGFGIDAPEPRPRTPYWSGPSGDAALLSGVYAPDSWLQDGAPGGRHSHTAVWTGAEMIVWGGQGLSLLDGGARYDPGLDVWRPMTTDHPPLFRIDHTAIWTGSELIVWGGWQGTTSSYMNTGGRYDPALDRWEATSTVNAAYARTYHSAVWTGNEMLIWGGFNNNYLTDGFRYKPATNSWTAMAANLAIVGRRYHTAVWTGEHMIVWGGQDSGGVALNDGERYLPATNSWSAVGTTGTPAVARWQHTAAWTGTYMIVWGGYNGTTAHNSGKRYDPFNNSWSAMTSPAITGRYRHSSVWTGTRMIVWGGQTAAGTFLNNGAYYIPNVDTWLTLASSGAPAARTRHSAVWTGSEMIVYGGAAGPGVIFGDAARYNPVTNVWAAVTSQVPRSGNSNVWTGAEMLVWGGWDPAATSLDTGLRYRPSTDTWTTIPASVLSARGYHTGIWTGSRMVLWGGYNGASLLSSGAIYDPGAGTWSLTRDDGTTPTARDQHTAVWTGSKMVVWGGRGFIKTGGRYDPATNTWSATLADGTAPAGRAFHSVVWTGSKMVVWGGQTSTFVETQTGGRYDPVADSWSSTLVDGTTPLGRWSHTAVWTGSQMLVFGGDNSSPGVGLADVSRYDPVANTWSVSLAPGAPSGRTAHTAVWTGHEMIVWGGTPITSSGGRYLPTADSWTPTSIASPPPGRQDTTSIWTGEAMIVYGGQPGAGLGIYHTDSPPTSTPDVLNQATAQPDTIRIGDGIPLMLTQTLPTGWWDDVELADQWSCNFCDALDWHRITNRACAAVGDQSSGSSAWAASVDADCDYDDLNGTYWLTSDCTKGDHCNADGSFSLTASSLLSFRYLLETDSSKGDQATVEVSDNDGGSWVPVAKDASHLSGSPLPAAMADTGEAWRIVELKIADYLPGLDPTDKVRVRFTFYVDGTDDHALGFLIDDIGVGEPRGDGSNPCTTAKDSVGSNPQGGMAYHDAWDRATYAWDLDADGAADNPDPTTPTWSIPEATLAAYGLASQGDHTLTMTVQDLRMPPLPVATSITLHVLDGIAPQASLVVPNGGESWEYSPSASSRRVHTIVWSASDNNPPLERVQLEYTSNGTTWTCIADSTGTPCAAGTLSPDDIAFDWAMPTQAEAAASGQTFPTAAAKVRVTVWDDSGNATTDASAGDFYIIQPTASSVDTIVLWSSARIAARYGAPSRDALALKLGELANHHLVRGAILDVTAVPAIQSAYTAWDAAPTSTSLANAVAAQIRTYLLSQIGTTFTNARHLVLVGDDEQIPFLRMLDGTSIHPETSYPSEVGLSTSTTVGAAIAGGYFLSDDYYAELEPESTDLPPPHDLRYLNDLATGRLVETPGQMTQVINAFLAQDGQVELLNASETMLVAGFDFLYDSATGIRAAAATSGETTTCLLDDPEASGNVDPCVDKPYSGADLQAALLAPTPPQLTNINTHADHYNLAASTGGLSTTAMSADPDDLFGTVVFTSGCHSGLPVPSVDPHPLDLPELMASKNAVAYVGNTGYGWGLRRGEGLTERLMRLMADGILESDSISVGQALADAKRAFVLEERRYDVFDEKVVHELTLFGIPNYLVVSDVATADAALPPAGADFTRACVDGICVEKQQFEGGMRAGLLTLPPGVTQLDLSFTFGGGTYSPVSSQDGTYYTLNGRSSGEVGDSVQPHFTYDSTLSGTKSHGILFLGGIYNTIPAFNPVVAVPNTSNYGGSGEGSLPMRLISVPNMNFTSNRQLLGNNFMSVDTGVFRESAAEEQLFASMQTTAYYSNSSDVGRPVITDPGASGFHVLDGTRASFTATASDPGSGVYRVLVTYGKPGGGSWSSLDLSFDAGSATWKGTLDLTQSVDYFVQAVDNAGNVGVLSVSGNDLDGGSAAYGSTWSGPKTYTIALPDTDGDGMPDAYEDRYPCLNKLVSDASQDPDSDYRTSLQEMLGGTLPCNGDSDGGGDNDGSELANGRDPNDGGDDLLLTINVSKVGSTYTVSWADALGSNGAIDGYYFVYRSDTPFFDPTDRLNGSPIPNGTTSYNDVGPPCSTCYYKVWNYAVATPPPVVAVVVPSAGPVSGGTSVQVFGTGFTAGGTVAFGGVAATNVVFISPNLLTCTTPAHSAGAVEVRVTNPNGQDGALPNGFTYQ